MSDVRQSSFHHQFWIDTWKSQFEQPTYSILSACKSHGQNHKDPDTIDLNAPRHAQYMHKAWKRHQNTVYWVDINLALRKGLKFYQTRSFFTKHFQLIVFRNLSGWKLDKSYTRKKMRPPPKISLKHDWKRGSEDAQRPEGLVVQPSRSSQSSHPIPNPDHDRTGQPVFLEPIERGNPLLEPTQGSSQVEEKTSRSQEIETRSHHEEAVKHDRTGKPVVETRATQTRSSDDSKSFNVEDKAAHDRTGQPVVRCHTHNVPDGSQTRSSHESTSSNVGDETIHDRTLQPVVNRHESGHEQTMLNEVNMDFRIPGLPHSVVKHAQSTSVRELIQKN